VRVGEISAAGMIVPFGLLYPQQFLKEPQLQSAQLLSVAFGQIGLFATVIMYPFYL